MNAMPIAQDVIGGHWEWVTVATAAVMALAVILLIARKRRRNRAEDDAVFNPPDPTPATPPQSGSGDAIARRAAELFKRRKEIAEKAAERSKHAARFVVPLALIASSVALGWNNITSYAAEHLPGVTSTTAPLLVVLFSGTALWAGWERYMTSRRDRASAQFAALLWVFIGSESLVHVMAASNRVDHGGTAVLAALPIAAGVTFEMAFSRTRKDFREKNDADANRELPGELKANPVMYLRMLRVKAENPDWNARQIIDHTRAVRFARIAEQFAHVHSKGRFGRWIHGYGHLKTRLRKALVETNPTGSPDKDVRLTVAGLLGTRHAAEGVALAKGDPEAILKLLEKPAETRRDNNGDGFADVDAFIADVFANDVPPLETPGAGAVLDPPPEKPKPALPTADGDGPGTGRPARQDGDSDRNTAGSAPDTGKAKTATTDRTAKKTAPAKTASAAKNEDVRAALADLVRADRTVSVNAAKAHLDKCGIVASRATVARTLKDVKGA